jgi:hypothetical protein
MFQYAYVRAISLRNNVPFLLDINWYKNYALHGYGLEKFTIQKSYAEDYQIPWYMQWQWKKHHLILQSILKKINRNHYQEKHFHFDKDMLNITRWYIEWYFQSEKYFADFANDIRKDFSFMQEASQKNRETINTINTCNAVSLHIRRWDYVSNPVNGFYNVCDLAYYQRAIAYMATHISDPIFFIFSDDIQRVKDNLKIDYPHHYIDWNNADTNYEDMRLMSLCKHNIIANSSFSWRWAWLNSNPHKIIVWPKRRFSTDKLNYKDVIPPEWIKI